MNFEKIAIAVVNFLRQVDPAVAFIHVTTFFLICLFLVGMWVLSRQFLGQLREAVSESRKTSLISSFKVSSQEVRTANPTQYKYLKYLLKMENKNHSKLKVKKTLIGSLREEGECPHPSCLKTLRKGTENFRLHQPGGKPSNGYCSEACLWKHYRMLSMTMDLLPNTDLEELDKEFIQPYRAICKRRQYQCQPTNQKRENVASVAPNSLLTSELQTTTNSVGEPVPKKTTDKKHSYEKTK